MKKKIFIYGILLLLCVFVGCKEEEKVSSDKEKIAHLENIVENGVKPTFAKTKSAFEALKQQVASFQNNPTENTVEGLRSQFKTVMLNWKSCEIYNMGDVKSTYLYGSMNFWPADPTRIEDKLVDVQTDNLTIDEEFVNKLGASLKSVFAVEYLLFHEDVSTIVLEFANDSNRGQYLKEVVNYLDKRFGKINQAWDEYATVFVVPNNENKVKDGYSVALNSVVQLLEYIKNIKLGDPLGDSSGAVNSNKLEAHYSGISLEIIEKNVEQIEYMLMGNYPGSQTNAGFDDYFKVENKEHLNDAMAEKLNDIKEKIEILKGQPLSVSINTQTQKVKDLQASVQNLLRFCKKDLKQALNVTIMISDTDGD